jgi:uncharacterized protein
MLFPAHVLASIVFAALSPALANAPDEAACDRLAAVPFDTDKPSGVKGAEQIEPSDISEAVKSCEEAARAPGAHRRFWLQYGRALEYAGRAGEAIPAYEKAAAAGSTMAMLGLSDVYGGGKGVRQDIPKAMNWLEKAAAAGNAAAMNNLGAIYGTGGGVAKDYAKSKEWYEKAAAANFPAAQYQLGMMAMEGQGGPKDPVAAKAWFEKAAAQDDADSLYELGLILANGLAGAKDEQAARGYLKRAAELGSEEAVKALNKLAAPSN